MNIKKNFTLGGSMENALTGQYELKVGAVLQEAWQLTVKNFVSFTPAIIALLFVQLAVFYIALKMQLGDPTVILTMLQDPTSIDPSIFDAIFVANFSYEVVSAPIFAGVSLMAMSHAAGIKTKTSHMLKGLSFTIPVILVTLLSLVLQGVAGLLLPFLSMYFSLVFSNAILLVCEKRITPMRSLFLSWKAVNKKLIPISVIYFVLVLLMFLSAIFYGILLIATLPLFFHAKGVIYRDMFGISLAVVSTSPSDHDDDSNDNDSSHGTNEPNDDQNKNDSNIFNA